jgi:hypothetical protein
LTRLAESHGLTTFDLYWHASTWRNYCGNPVPGPVGEMIRNAVMLCPGRHSSVLRHAIESIATQKSEWAKYKAEQSEIERAWLANQPVS